MTTFNLWEHQQLFKTLYASCVEPVCSQYQLTRNELDILLFLANNPAHDTAAEIVSIRYLTKSHVSLSVQALEQKGYLRRFYAPHDRRTPHLCVTDAAQQAVQAGRAAQEAFVSALFRGIGGQEQEALRGHFARIEQNARDALEANT